MSDHIFRCPENSPGFAARHIGPRAQEQQQMLAALGVESLQALAAEVVPASILATDGLDLPAGASEAAVLARLRELADQNQVFTSLIGQGYYNTHTPTVILRNVLENPAWYTAYTPYQPEISQGRLEAMLSFQTMVSDLCGLEIANASLLDEGTAAAEAMALCRRQSRQKSNRFFVAADCFAQTIDIVRARAEPLGIEVVVGDPEHLPDGEFFGALVQYPGADGEVRDLQALATAIHEQQGLVVAAADLLALTLLKPPGEWGADVAVGSTQRFGVPMAFGGPHAAYMATREGHKRAMPGRLVGVSIDRHGHPAYRLALQTREQHIRREKATSNICTAQVLLAVMAAMYAVYHGPEGLCAIAGRVARMTAALAAGLRGLGLAPEQTHFFDTLTLATGARTADLHAAARAERINLRVIDDHRLGLSLDETVTEADLGRLLRIFGASEAQASELLARAEPALPQRLRRISEFMQHPCFHEHRSETGMLRYLRRLADRDLALDRSMIPLGSCTMKLNATTEMIPVTWPGFAAIHPFAPGEQTRGYRQLIEELEQMLCRVTGYDAVSLQPNAGSQGEYAGLLAISAYHRSRGEAQRDVCLIPASAHGTNPASAQMAGMRVVVVRCDHEGNVDLQDLRAKAEAHSQQLAAIMITYPSTHGVFEAEVREVCRIVHDHGGQVYIDGANLNAMVGVCYPGEFGGDVSHLNLHKTFAIPHGGGGPGVGPVAVRAHLAPFLPGHRHHSDAAARTRAPVAAAPWGSAGILPISWAYMKLMGAEGLRDATLVAILNANYLAQRLQPHYPVLYTGPNDRVAHECILDLRPLKEATGVSVDDVAKRLIDYGFHAPTMSFPVAGTLMVEPTESESLHELERFCEAMIAIREEIRAIEQGRMDPDNNPLKNAPHTADDLVAADWPHPYSREQAVFPLATLRAAKYWPPVARIDNVYGDRNLVCSCPAPTEYETA